MNITIHPYTDDDQKSMIKLWEKVFPGAPPHNNPARSYVFKSGLPKRKRSLFMEQ